MTPTQLSEIAARCEEHLRLLADDKIPLRTQGIYIAKFEQTCRTDIPALLKEVERLREALEEIVVESGKVDIANWPAQQQICQSIARKALEPE